MWTLCWKVTFVQCLVHVSIGSHKYVFLFPLAPILIRFYCRSLVVELTSMVMRRDSYSLNQISLYHYLTTWLKLYLWKAAYGMYHPPTKMRGAYHLSKYSFGLRPFNRLALIFMLTNKHDTDCTCFIESVQTKIVL